MYLAREGTSGPLAYVGMAGERCGRGYEAGLPYTCPAKLSPPASERPCSTGPSPTRTWLKARLDEANAGQVRRAKEWGQLAFERADLHVCWATAADRAGAVSLERRCLVAHHPVEPAYNKALKTHRAVPAEAAALVAVLTQKGSAVPAVPAAPLPRVPYDNFPTFLAAARDQPDADSFDLVKARFEQAHRRAGELFDAVPDAAALPDRALSWLRHELLDCVTTDEMIVSIRAMQVAAFHAGWLINADVARLVVTATKANTTTVHSPETWRRLAAYRDPYRGAVCALAAADIAVTEMTSLRCDDIDPGGKLVNVERDEGTVRAEVPAGADVFLRAQLAHRSSQGADGDALLFADANTAVQFGLGTDRPASVPPAIWNLLHPPT